MARLDPRAPDSLTHSGTFNNNVLTMAAGLAGLTKVLTPEATIRLNDSGDRLRERLQDTADRHGVAMRAMGLGIDDLPARPVRRDPPSRRHRGHSGGGAEALSSSR